MAKIFITGGTGFLGTHLIETLLGRDDQRAEDLILLSRRGDAAMEAMGCTVVRGDVTDTAAVGAAMEGCQYVFHAAGLVDRSPDALSKLMTVHVEGTRAVLNAAAKVGVERVVYASTSGTIGVSKDAGHVATEDDPYPLEIVCKWPYYLSKVYAEQTALELADTHDLALVIVNPTLLLGPGDERLSSTTDVLKFLRHQIPSIPSGGLSFVDARDAALAMVAALERGVPGRRYLLTSANWTVDRFLRTLESVSGVRAPALKIPDAPARFVARLMQLGYDAVGRDAPLDRISVEMSQHFWYVDASLAEEELGFAPRDPQVTLQDTVDDLRTRYGIA